MRNASIFLLFSFDLDGTLIDSNYHHVIAWEQALRGRKSLFPLGRFIAA